MTHEIPKSPVEEWHSGRIGFDEMSRRMQMREQDCKKRIEKILLHPSINPIAKRRNLIVEDVYNLYLFCMKIRLNDLFWEIVANPDDLDALLDMIENRKSDDEIRQAFRSSPGR